MQSVSLLLKVLWSPGEAMFLLSKNPRVLTPVVFLCLFSLLASGIVLTKVDASELAMRAIERSAQGGNLPDETRESIRQQLNSPFFKAFQIVAFALGPIVLVVCVAAVYFGVFTLVGRDAKFKAFLSVTSFAFVPRIFSHLAAILSAFILPTSSIMADELGSLSPAVFLDRDSLSPLVFAAVNTVDLVSIWILCLLVIGFGFLVRKGVSKGACAGAVVGVFLIYVAFRLAFAALRGV